MSRTALSLTLLFFGQYSLAQDYSPAESIADVQMYSAADEDAKVIPAHGQWVFLGCAYDEDACHHHAHEHGYAQSSGNYDHHTCTDHHHPFACYGM